MNLGAHLRAEREKKGVTLEQLASATKINIRLLESLEGDRYNELPAKPFVRGFVTSYCKFIGINSEEILNQYNKYLNDKSTERPTNDGGHKGYAFETKAADQSRNTLWMVMAGFVVVGGIVLLVLKPALKHRRGTHLDKLKQITATPNPTDSLGGEIVTAETTTVAPALAVTQAVVPIVAPPPVAPVVTAKPTPTPKPTLAAKLPKPSASPSPSPLASGTPKPDPLNKGDDLKATSKEKITLKSLADFTLRYKVDEKPTMTYILKKGISIAIQAEKKIWLEVSNPKAAQIRYRTREYAPIVSEKMSFEKAKGLENKEVFPDVKPLVKTPDPQ
ncbi:MAG: helix-turn-helix domain-containing protein [Xanthomonadaceae bacterium]|nr:helix-turn-helix domain-containing protein [Xanthomonadaceae bacterium]